MKTISRIVLIAAGLALAPTLASADWQNNRFDSRLYQRSQHQQQRIAHGIHAGSLNPWEVKRAEHHEQQLHRLTGYAMQDGHISPREFRIVNDAYDRQSHFIYRQKHDGDCDRR